MFLMHVLKEVTIGNAKEGLCLRTGVTMSMQGWAARQQLVPADNVALICAHDESII